MKRWKLILIGLAVLTLLAFWQTGSHWFRETYIIEISNTEKDSGTGLKMVYGTMPDGETKAFTCEDSWLEGVINSRDIFAVFAQGKKYKMRVYGVRWHWPWTCYENIIKAVPYTGPKTLEDLDVEIKGLEKKLSELREKRKLKE